VASVYCTLPQYKAEWVVLPDSIDDNKIVRAITAASRAIDNYCGRPFWQSDADTTRVFDICDSVYTLDIHDATTVTAVKTDDDSDGTFETTWAAGDYQLLPLHPTVAGEQHPYRQIRAIGTRTFPQITSPNGRVGLVQVTGTWGWPALPEGVVQGCLLIANRLVKRSESPEGVTGFDEFGMIRISSRDDPDAIRLIEPYRLVGIA
jgi:hypothetical protein